MMYSSSPFSLAYYRLLPYGKKAGFFLLGIEKRIQVLKKYAINKLEANVLLGGMQ
jgi:hypothetical protein